MRRRQVLSIVGGGVSVSLSGCLDSVPVIGSSDEEIAEQVAVLDHSIGYAESDTSNAIYAIVDGEATNVTENTLPSVIIQAVFYDSEGREIAANGAAQTDIKPADVFDFSIEFPTPQSSPRKAEQIDSYELTILQNLNGSKLPVSNSEESPLPSDNDQTRPSRRPPEASESLQ